jgi:hypothetical protein
MVMQLELTTPALLFPAVAILMLGYINRYIGIAGVIRTFKKDYDGGYKHVDVVKQLRILRKRVEIARLMLASGAFALLLACLSMFLIFERFQVAGEAIFATSLLFMIVSISLSLYETALSNKSLGIEIDDIMRKEKAKND